MKKFTLIALSFMFLLTAVGIQDVSAQNESAVVKTGIITLYSKDPLAQTFCFEDGKYGKIIQEYEVRNRCSDIGFDNYVENSFSVGIEGGREGRIINLGTAEALQQRYKYQETVGKGQGFASIQFQNGNVFILKKRIRRQSDHLQELVEANALIQEEKQDNIPAKLGNIYIMRLTDRYDKSFERIVKFIVTDYEPDRFATIRWQVIFDSEDKRKGK